MLQTVVELFLLIVLPLLPAAYVFRTIAERNAVNGFLGKIRIKFSGPIALYFILVILISYYLNASVSRQRVSLQDELGKNKAKLKQTEADLGTARGEIETLRSTSTAQKFEELIGQINALKTENTKLSTELANPRRTGGDDKAEIWTVRGYIAFEPMSGPNISNRPDDTSFDRISIVVWPPPQIELDGRFELKVIKTLGSHGQPVFPNLSIVKANYRPKMVRLGPSDKLGDVCKKTYDEVNQEIWVTDPVVLSYDAKDYNKPVNHVETVINGGAK